jgi:uncharacterized protein YjcR
MFEGVVNIINKELRANRRLQRQCEQLKRERAKDRAEAQKAKLEVQKEKLEAREETARKMKLKGYPVDEIADITGFSPDQIARL